MVPIRDSHAGIAGIETVRGGAMERESMRKDEWRERG
jgi:hypothetical protein